MKEYRLYSYRKFGRKYFLDRYKIGLRFSLFPQKVDGEWSFLSFYYSLTTMTGAINLGGQITPYYKINKRSKTLFGFREILKKEGIIKNNAEERRSIFKMRETWPKYFRDIMDNQSYS